MDRQQEFVLRTIEERDVRFVRLWFTDVVGSLKSVALAPAEVEDAFAEGLGFDGSSIEGLSRIYESDMLLQPDPSTFQLLPWRGEVEPTSRMFCDILTPEHPLHRGPAPRAQAPARRGSKLGFTCYTHPEIEFYLLQSAELGPHGARCRSTMPATSTTSRTGLARTSAAVGDHPGGAGHLRGVLPP